MNNYDRLDIAFKRGQGAWLTSTEGHRYLDAISGIAVCALGHAHPQVEQAICEQAGQLLHTSNLYQIPLQQQLADRLIALSGMEQAFFCNSGAEANETAIKLTRLYAHQLGYQDPCIIATGGFHGRTMATLSANGNPLTQQGFAPLLPGFKRVPYNDLTAIEQLIAHHQQVVAIFVEPILGEGGVIVPDKDYLPGIRKICDDFNILMVVDEIQTGLCRSGRWFASQHADIIPDIMTLAKSLANGVPVGACLARGQAAKLFTPGSHGSTFGGNPLAMRVALTVLDTLTQQKLDSRAHILGESMRADFQAALKGVEIVKQIRGMGLMIGIELTVPCTKLMEQALALQLLINVTAKKTIRLLPPLIISDEQACLIVETVCELIHEFQGYKG